MQFSSMYEDPDDSDKEVYDTEEETPSLLIERDNAAGIIFCYIPT